jgi:hypothetical protein
MSLFLVSDWNLSYVCVCAYGLEGNENPEKNPKANILHYEMKTCH